MSINVDIDFSKEALANIEDWRQKTANVVTGGEFNKSLAMAVKRAADHGKTRFKQSITSKYTAKSKTIAELMRVVHIGGLGSTRGSPSAEIRFQGSRLPITDYFKVTPKSPAVQKGKVPSSRKRAVIEVLKGQKRPSRRAFVANLPVRGLRLYHRDKNTGKLRTRTGSSIVTMVDKDEVRDPAWNSVHRVLSERVDHEMKRLLNR